jgi:lipopolysaccharide transport protein LptA
MAHSLLVNLCACGLVLASGLASVAQESSRNRQELVFESGPLTFNSQTKVFEIEAPRIRQGDLFVSADAAVATSIDFESASEWRFQGNVRIESGAAVIGADSAVFTFTEEQLSRGEIAGSPATFTHTVPERPKPTTGTADSISYDHDAGTLRMSGNALLRREQNEIQSCDLIYNLMTEGFSSGNSDCGFRLVRVAPESDQRGGPTPPP